MMRMMIVAGALAILVIGAAVPAAAIEYPWCANYSVRGGATNCGFSTYEQCRDTISGVGGMCRRNPFYQGAAAGDEGTARPRAKKQRRTAR